ncbi:MAG: CAP domain-containing protein [Actinomycetota bacterium]
MQFNPEVLRRGPWVIAAVATLVGAGVLALLVAAFVIDDGGSGVNGAELSLAGTDQALAPQAADGAVVDVNGTGGATATDDGSGDVGDIGSSESTTSSSDPLGESTSSSAETTASSVTSVAPPTTSKPVTTAAPTTAAPTTAAPTTAAPTTAAPTTAAPTTAAPTTAAPTTAAPTTAAPTTPAPPSDSGGEGQIRQDILNLVNAERSKAGCSAVSLNGTLNNAADGHAHDMANNDYFSHTGLNGSSPGDRITAAGYSWRTYGENIAAGQRDAQQVMTAWMNSSGHRANILNCSFAELGVGYALRGNTPYWVQKFGTSR